VFFHLIGAAMREYGVTQSVEFRAAKWVRCCLLVAVATLMTPALSPAVTQNLAVGGPEETLEGKLMIAGQGRPALKTAKRDYTLSAKTPYLLHTLQDQRLGNREVRVEGTFRPGGIFEVAHLFTVREGKLYKVKYYCNVCNITALEPGECVCCQRTTELQEIPLNEIGKDAVVVP